jgi:methionyl-tRNA formyltransferase
VRALDAGPMLADVRRPIGRNDTSDEVERDLAKLGADLLAATLDRIAAGSILETPQDDSQATYAHRLTREDGLIDWDWPAERVHNLVRGLHPWPHAYSYLDGERLIIRRSMVGAGSAPPLPGTILSAHGGDLHVAAGEGILQIVELQAEGKRPMSARDFMAGHPLAPGRRLTRTP